MRPTLGLPEAAKILGIGKTTAYEAVQKGTFPVPVIHVGARVIVPTKPLLDKLGLDEFPKDAA